MRKIKFRAWSKHTKRFVSDNDAPWCVTYDGRFAWWDDGQGWTVDDGVSIMQFTGLLDKNGKDIFEGDIVKDSGGEAVVEWDEDSSGFIAWFEHFNILNFPKNCEIIGNKWESPDLLN